MMMFLVLMHFWLKGRKCAWVNQNQNANPGKYNVIFMPHNEWAAALVMKDVDAEVLKSIIKESGILLFNDGYTDEHPMTPPANGFEIRVGSGQYFGKVKYTSDLMKEHEVVERWSFEEYKSAINRDTRTRLLFVKNNINHILDVMEQYFEQEAVALKDQILNSPDRNQNAEDELENFLGLLWLAQDLSKTSFFSDSDYDSAAILFQKNDVLGQKIILRRYFASGPNGRHFFAATEQQIKTDFNMAKERYQQSQKD